MKKIITAIPGPPEAELMPVLSGKKVRTRLQVKKGLFCILLLIAFLSSRAQDDRRPDPSAFKIPVLKAIAYGITAPSPHNTQSWFVDTISGTEMYLYVKNVLPATDPPARQIHMGAGCFIELVAIGMSKEGFETRVEYFPEGEYKIENNMMASKPVAKITLVKNPEIQKDILYDFITQRCTNRKPYDGKMITPEEFNQIRSLTGHIHSDMSFITGEAEMKPYLDIFSKGMEIETRTTQTNEETRKMFRFSEQERQEKKDGLSIPQMGMDGIIRKFAEGSLNHGDSATWHSDKNFKSTMNGINKGIYSARGIILFKTTTNNMLDWVLAGRDYARYNVAIAKLGLATHPYNQVLQEYPEMASLQKEFTALTKTGGTEKTQMIVRVGRAKSPYKSWRKNVGDYLIPKGSK